MIMRSHGCAMGKHSCLPGVSTPVHSCTCTATLSAMGWAYDMLMCLRACVSNRLHAVLKLASALLRRAKRIVWMLVCCSFTPAPSQVARHAAGARELAVNNRTLLEANRNLRDGLAKALKFLESKGDRGGRGGGIASLQPFLWRGRCCQQL